MSGCSEACRIARVLSYLVAEGFLVPYKVPDGLLLLPSEEARRALGPAAAAILLHRYLGGDGRAKGSAAG